MTDITQYLLNPFTLGILLLLPILVIGSVLEHRADSRKKSLKHRAEEDAKKDSTINL
ncbi:MAG: hypothetical protein AAGG69_14740 [Pseudomonadota bacterium]